LEPASVRNSFSLLSVVEPAPFRNSSNHLSPL
jgi:hypothetical protein